MTFLHNNDEQPTGLKILKHLMSKLLPNVLNKK